MSSKILIQELKDLLKTVVNKDNKIPKNKMPQFDIGFTAICVDVDRYKDCDFGGANRAIVEMKKILSEVTADDKEFPERQLEQLLMTVAPWEWDG